MSSAPIDNGYDGVLPDGRHRALQPARARHRQALHHARPPPRRAAANSRPRSIGDTVKRIKNKFDIPLDHQGHRDRRGCQDRARARRRLRLRVEPRRPAARSRPRLDGRAAGGRRCGRAAAPRSSIDGGFYRGSDIVKAIAAGADLVGIGRMQCYALAAAGQAGIVRMLELLEDEVQRCWGCSASRSFADLDRSYLHAAVPANAAARVQRVPAAQDRRLSLLISSEPFTYSPAQRARA